MRKSYPYQLQLVSIILLGLFQLSSCQSGEVESLRTQLATCEEEYEELETLNGEISNENSELKSKIIALQEEGTSLEEKSRAEKLKEMMVFIRDLKEDKSLSEKEIKMITNIESTTTRIRKEYSKSPSAIGTIIQKQSNKRSNSSHSI